MKKQEINSLIERWLQIGAINQEQATYMIADVESVTSEKSGSKFISAIMYIGATGLSLGALLLIASNWTGLSKVVKLVLALLLPILPICFAYGQLIVKNESKVLGEASNILGLALVGGSLAIIGQTYNLESNMTSFLWTWALITTPFVLVFKRKENALFSAILIGTALFFSILDFLGSSRMEEGTAILLLTIAGLTYAYVLYAIGVGLRYVTSLADSGRLLRIGAASFASTILFFMTFAGIHK